MSRSLQRRLMAMVSVTVIGVVLWGLSFVIALGVFENQANPAPTITPTARPTRQDIAEISADFPTLTPYPTFTPIPSATPSPSATATITATHQDTLTPTLTLEASATATPTATRTPTPTATPTLLNGGFYPIRLAVEAVEVLAPVLVVGYDPQFNVVTPADSVGFYALSSKLGGGGNSVFVGHVYPGRVFNRLLDIQEGQVIRITDEGYNERYYQVTEIVTIRYEAGNTEDLQLGLDYIYDQSEERITLVTCYPEYDWTHRFVVRAVPIPPPNE